MKKIKQLGLTFLFGLNAMAFAQTPPTTMPVEQNAVTQPVQQTQITNANAVNINTASAAELQDKLVGIGQKKLKRLSITVLKTAILKTLSNLLKSPELGKQR